MSKLKIGIIIGSTRDTRFGEKPARWMLDLAAKREEIEAELIDLRDYDLPLFNEVSSNAWQESESPQARAWQKKIGEMDGFIFVTAEYNRSIPGALKNALDQAYVEWNYKPAAIVGYGSVGGARAVEHLRSISVELYMVPVRSTVHISGTEFFTVWHGGGDQPMTAIEGTIGQSAQELLDQLIWWAELTKAGRAEKTKKSA
ncbi:MAG TPA: NADPH-dependent FMN reductase [Rhizobiaceae bacterium]|nr:NADPH-dependent FMN reductase [Rhizobiaceae bacterium]